MRPLFETDGHVGDVHVESGRSSFKKILVTSPEKSYGTLHVRDDQKRFLEAVACHRSGMAMHGSVFLA